MNILIIARADHSGAGNALREAINGHTSHTVKAVAFKKKGYPVEILSPVAHELHKLMNWADVLNVHDDGFSVMPKPRLNKPVIRTYHGSWYRRCQKKEDGLAKQNRWARHCLTLDLSTTGAVWVGRPMPNLSHLHRPTKGTFRVAHAPSQPHRKGTKSIAKALEGLSGITLDVITKVSNRQCIRRKVKSHLLADKTAICPASHGTNALESWSIGTPVVAEIRPWICDLIQKRLGYLPFCLPEGGFRSIVERFRDDATFYEDWRQLGMDYVQKWHDPKAVAEQFVSLIK